MDSGDTICAHTSTENGVCVCVCGGGGGGNKTKKKQQQKERQKNSALASFTKSLADLFFQGYPLVYPYFLVSIGGCIFYHKCSQYF